MADLDTSCHVHVQRGGVVRLNDAVGVRVICRDGSAWVTLEDDIRDILLEPGEAFTIDRRGVSLVCAIAGPADVEFEAAHGGEAVPVTPLAPVMVAIVPQPTSRAA